MFICLLYPVFDFKSGSSLISVCVGQVYFMRLKFRHIVRVVFIFGGGRRAGFWGAVKETRVIGHDAESLIQFDV